MHTSQLPRSPWDTWLDGTLQHLRDTQLLRTLRPTVWCNSSSEALIHRADLDAWAAGREPVVRHYDHCASLAGSASAVYAPTHGASANSSTNSSSGSAASASGVPPSHGAGEGPSAGSCPGSGSGAGAAAASSTANELVRLKLFSLNDYLGLASHPEVAAAAARAASTAGMGPRSSGLVGGYTHSHRQLEEGLARLKATEDCLLFPTGFAANLSLMTALAGTAPGPSPSSSSSSSSSSSPRVTIFSDELNHASIIDGARLAVRGGGAAVHVYRHNDLAHLEELLDAAPPGCRCLVVTDSLFSMDGDFADLRGLAALKARHPSRFLLALDEAHATLVAGPGGGGAAEAAGVADAVDLHVGTLSKAFGSLGGFVACSSPLKALLANRGRALVYSTALPLPVVEAAAAALRVSQRESWRRAHVWRLAARLGAGLGVPALSPIVPLVVGPEGPTLQLAAQLLRQGMHVPAIRPPTVPQGTCRLRVSLSAAHTEADVDALIAAVRASGVALARLPHLADPRAALPGGAAGRGEGWEPEPPGRFAAVAAGRPLSRL